MGGGNASQLTLTPLASTFGWPNVVSYHAAGVIGSADILLVADGFLVPGKSTGGIYAVPSPTSGQDKSVCLTTPKTGYFYHMTVLRDMNGDGRLDVLTARVNKPLLGKSTGQLVWLEQPATDNPFSQVPWLEHVLVEGPDVIFVVAQLSTVPGTFQVVAAEFFSFQSLTIYSFNSTTLALLWSRAIDDSVGAFEAVYLADLNADGRTEIVASTHLGGAGGAIYAYEIPPNLQHGSYARHTLADNFPVTEGGPQQASPGFSYAVHPKVADQASRPYILVAGDGSQAAYVMTPCGDAFAYNITQVTKVKGVIGSIGYGDTGKQHCASTDQFKRKRGWVGSPSSHSSVSFMPSSLTRLTTRLPDQDGFLNFFVPDYDQGILLSYSFTA